MISDFILSIKNILNYNRLQSEYKNYVFFSENKNYQNFYINLINLITSRNKKIIYISCNRNDIIQNNTNVINIILPSFFIRTFFLSIIKCKFFFLTTSDLGFNEIKKSKSCFKYVYIFHSHISCHVQYNEKAFFNYDIFCCNNLFQFNELNLIISKYNLKKKKILKTGYLYGDFLKKVSFSKPNKFYQDEILIAPTWYKNNEGLFDNGLDSLLKILVEKKFKITLRLHPEHMKRSKKKIDNIVKNYGSKNLNIEKNILDFASLIKSRYLITDYSGIAIEYMYYFNKPTLYYNCPKKIHNKNYKFISGNSFEQEIKQYFGTIFSLDDFLGFENIFKKADYQFRINKNKMINYFKNNIYHEGRSENVILYEINKIENNQILFK